MFASLSLWFSFCDSLLYHFSVDPACVSMYMCLSPCLSISHSLHISIVLSLSLSFYLSLSVALIILLFLSLTLLMCHFYSSAKPFFLSNMMMRTKQKPYSRTWSAPDTLRSCFCSCFCSWFWSWFWSCLIVFDCVWLCLTVFDRVWNWGFESNLYSKI